MTETPAPEPRQLTPKQQRSIELMAEVKFAVRMLLQKYATESFEISSGQQDPALPVISVVQMALAQAAVEYLCTAGRTPAEGVQQMTMMTEKAMHAWLNTLFRGHSATAPQAGTVPVKPASKGKRRRGH